MFLDSFEIQNKMQASKTERKSKAERRANEWEKNKKPTASTKIKIMQGFCETFQVFWLRQTLTHSLNSIPSFCAVGRFYTEEISNICNL